MKASVQPTSRPSGNPWIEDRARLAAIFAGVSEHFGPRLRFLSFERSVYEGPLDAFKVVLDRTSGADLKALGKLALGECVLAIHAKYGIRVRILPTAKVDSGLNAAGKPAKGPYDQGPAAPKRRREVSEALDTGKLRSFAAYDNVYGRTVTIVGQDRDDGGYLMKSAGDGLLFVRYRLLKLEIVQLFANGWLR